MPLLYKKSLLQKIFINPLFLKGFINLLLQQIIVALSVYLLAKSVALLTHGKIAFIYWFLAYMASMILPYLPGLISNYFFDLWGVHLIGTFQRSVFSSAPYKAQDFCQNDLGNNKTVIFSNTAPEIIKDSCLYAQTLLAKGLNSFLTMLTITYVVSPLMAVTYLISFLGCLFFHFFASKIAKNKTRLTEKERIALATHNASIWPHLTLKNSFSNKIWKHQFESKFQNFFSAFQVEERFRNLSALIMAMISLLPTAGVLIFITMTHLHDMTYLGVILASAPRIFQLVTMLVEFSSLIFMSSRYFGKIEIIQAFFDRTENTENKITFEKIELFKNNLPLPKALNFSEIQKIFLAHSHGRFLIKGDNGAGKSTLLLNLKEHFGDMAFYLPPQASLCFDEENLRHHSTGEQKRFEILSILKNAQIKYLLLDEWDANLDSANLQKISDILTEYQKKITIIEVRHRI